MKSKILFPLVTGVTLLFTGCGGGGTSSPLSPEQIAIAKIAAYATGESNIVPDASDYEDAGIPGITRDNVDDMNDFVQGTDSDKLDVWITDSDEDGLIDGIDETPNNARPTANPQSITLDEDTSKTMTLTGSDREGDPLSYTIVVSPSHGSLSGTLPTITYTPDPDYYGTDSFLFKAYDGYDYSTLAEVSITINGVIDPINITHNNQVVSLGHDREINVEINMGSEHRDLYVLLSNYSPTSSGSATINHDAKRVLPETKKQVTPLTHIIKHRAPTPTRIQKSNQNLSKKFNMRTEASSSKKLTAPKKLYKAVGDTQTFYLDESNTGNTTEASLRKIVSDISTYMGTKTLNVWVSDDVYENGSCTEDPCVTDTMIDEMADTFLKAGYDNDIYDWVTNIYGEEWGSQGSEKYDNVIGETNEIHILLTDIPEEGVIGYFQGKDNFTNDSNGYSGSNQKVMFYIDAKMYANRDYDDYWQKETYSTLAHEFQHMIHFYQKNTILETRDDTWINEMLSETTEDLIATKIEHTGPRGVDPTDGSAGSAGNRNGRYPDFNPENTLSLTTWNDAMADYAKVNAFGTFLLRNYGGAKILHDIMYNDKAHIDSIEQATGKSFARLLQEWGVAVMLSDQENLEDLPAYNTGDFTEDHYDKSTYALGSINFFNYDPEPLIKTTSGSVEKQGNYYYKVGEDLNGTVNIDLSLNGYTEAIIIVK